MTMTLYYITYRGSTIGPMTADELLGYPVTADTPVCTTADNTWRPLYGFPELMERLHARARSDDPLKVNTTGKDHIAAGLLAIILGILGIQYFYLGKPFGGLMCILLTLCTCGLWKIIMIIQGILMLTMDQSEFEHKYVLNRSPFPVF